jgi:hypothetical protein
VPNLHPTPTSEGVTPPRGHAERGERRKNVWKGTSSLSRLTVFVRYENVVRLLEFLGYRQDE